MKNKKIILKKKKKNPAYAFQLPTDKLVTEEIESNDEDGEPMYQNQKVQFHYREKSFTEDYIVQIVERVVPCFGKRYGNIYSNQCPYYFRQMSKIEMQYLAKCYR